jgi:hypothetical protein
MIEIDCHQSGGSVFLIYCNTRVRFEGGYELRKLGGALEGGSLNRLAQVIRHDRRSMPSAPKPLTLGVRSVVIEVESRRRVSGTGDLVAGLAFEEVFTRQVDQEILCIGVKHLILFSLQ